VQEKRRSEGTVKVQDKVKIISQKEKTNSDHHRCCETFGLFIITFSILAKGTKANKTSTQKRKKTGIDSTGNRSQAYLEPRKGKNIASLKRHPRQ